MPTLRDHLAAQDAGRGGGGHGGGHHGGGHHGGGHHRGHGRGGGVVFYDRDPDVIVVREDCPPGFYFDDFGNCRPLPYHSMGMNAGHFDERMRPIPCPQASGIEDMLPQGPAYDMRRPTVEAAGETAVPVGWFNPFDPFGSGKAFETNRERDALDAEIMTTDARVASAQKAGAKIPNEIIFDYVAFRKDWDVVKVADITNVQLSSMRARFQAQLDALGKYMKVDDLRPPESPAKTIPRAIDEFGSSVRTVGVASALAVVAVAIVGAIVLAPHVGPAIKGSLRQSRENAKIAKGFL
jgi:hypothetical protein